MTSTLRDLFYDPRIGLASKTSFLAQARHLGFTQKEVLAFLKAQEVAQLNKERGSKRHYFPLWGRGPGSYQCDLMFMDNPRNHAKQVPILNIIDMNSRMLYSYVLKDKTNAEVLKGLMDWVEEAREKPVYLQSDNGKEFMGKAVQHFLAAHGILHATVEPKDHQGQAMVERVHQTLRRLCKLYEDAFKQPWTKGFNDLVWNYNHRVHSSIGVQPAQASDTAGLAQRKEQYEAAQRDFDAFHIGAQVRKLIRKTNEYFDKGKATWSDRVYTITGTNGHHLWQLDDGTFQKHYDLQLVKSVEKASELPSLEPQRQATKRAKKVYRDLVKEGVSSTNVTESPRQAKAPVHFEAGPAPNPRLLPRDRLVVKNPRGSLSPKPEDVKYVQMRGAGGKFIYGKVMNGEAHYSNGLRVKYTPAELVAHRFPVTKADKANYKRVVQSLT